MSLLDAPAGDNGAQQGAPPASSGSAPPAGAHPNANGQASWLEQLPEDLRTSPALAKFSGLEGLARGYVNVERMIGGEKAPIPKDPNDQAAWENWYRASGRPDEPAQYELERPEQMPEGLSYDEQMEEWYRTTAHKAGLNKQQFRTFFEAYRDRMFAAHEANQAQVKQEITAAKLALQRDWGDKYELQMKLANAEFDALSQSTQAKLRAAGLNRDPEFIKYLASARGRITGEMQNKAGNSGPPLKTPDQLQTEIAEIRSKYNEVLMDKSHPEHQMRVRQLTELFAQLYPPPEQK